MAKLIDVKPDEVSLQISAEERERKRAYEIMRRCFDSIKIDDDEEDGSPASSKNELTKGETEDRIKSPRDISISAWQAARHRWRKRMRVKGTTSHS